MSETMMTELDDLRLDVSRLSEKELEALAQLIVKKLREAMRHEAERSGNL